MRRFVPFQTAQFWREGAAPVTTEFTLRVNVSLPATAGALAVHVNVPLELLHAGLLVLRFVAIEEGLPLNVVPFTVVSVMMTDCVLLETYCGLRLVA